VFHPHNLQPGDVFAGDFRVERPLAMGGMGAVYVVEQLSTGRKRALKLLLPSLVENPRTRERFEQEARIASRIESDHVVEVVGAGVDPQSGAPWLAMELLDGETLHARVQRTGPLSPAETLEVFRQMCHGLAAAHAAGLVHRDIKPENLYLAIPRREGIPFTLKILDFGIAKLTADVRGTSGATGAVGSPLWMAPEQTTPSGIVPATDVWALGLVAFHCLTGRSYWLVANAEDATLQGLLREVLMDPIEPASARAARLGVGHLIPPGFDAWFARAVSRDPSHRQQHASEALASLHVAFGTAPPASITYPSSHVVAAVSRAPSFPELGATAPNTVASVPLAPPPPKKSNALLWVVGILGVLLVGAIALIVIGGAAAGFYLSQDSASAAAPTSADAASPTAGAIDAGTPSAVGTEQSASTDPKKAAAGPVAPGQRPAGASDAGSGDPTTSSSAISMKDVGTAPARDYKLPWYNQKITQCWKGNEGAKADAGSYSATVTIKLDQWGHATSISVNPKTHKNFTSCTVVRSSEHPWGHGPVETKSFSFSF
jgi:serine/threonine protein kinase